MSVIGVVENGKVVLPSETKLPNGTRVRVEPLPAEGPEAPLVDAFREYIGIFDDLPSDLARNHDHYIHGAPKR